MKRFLLALAVLALGTPSLTADDEDPRTTPTPAIPVAAQQASGQAAFAGKVPERWDFTFDSRIWELGYEGASSRRQDRDYVLVGETVNNWTELITSQYFELPPDAALRTAFEGMIQTMQRGCPALWSGVIEESPDDILFEWGMPAPGCGNHPAQHELVRMVRLPSGLLALHYAKKTQRLTAQERDKWISTLRAATVGGGSSKMETHEEAPAPLTDLGYGGLTFGKSTPSDMNNVTGNFKGCDKDKPPFGVKDATLCTVVVPMSLGGPSNVTQQCLFEDGLLQEVRLAASEEATYRALVAELSRQYGAIKPPVFFCISKDRRILITDRHFFRVGGDVAAPKLVHRVAPDYPATARKARVEGAVIVEAVISAEGNVESARLLRHVDPMLDDSAVHAVTQWKYEPATLGGNPVPVYLTVTMTFRLDRSPNR